MKAFLTFWVLVVGVQISFATLVWKGSQTQKSADVKKSQEVSKAREEAKKAFGSAKSLNAVNTQPESAKSLNAVNTQPRISGNGKRLVEVNSDSEISRKLVASTRSSEKQSEKQSDNDRKTIDAHKASPEANKKSADAEVLDEGAISKEEAVISVDDQPVEFDNIKASTKELLKETAKTPSMDPSIKVINAEPKFDVLGPSEVTKWPITLQSEFEH
jgi:hypothetical protein